MGAIGMLTSTGALACCQCGASAPSNAATIRHRTIVAIGIIVFVEQLLCRIASLHSQDLSFAYD